MIIRERTYKNCGHCKHREVDQGEAYGCDNCRKEINYQNPEREYLSATVFKRDGGETKDLHACSWRCMVEVLRKEPCDHFISLPFVSYDNVQPGMRAEDFFAELRGQERRDDILESEK